MKKFLLLLAAAVAVTMLSAPIALAAAPSPTEPDLPTEIPEQDVPLAEVEEPVEIEEQDVPLAFVSSPQTGVSGSNGMEALALAGIAFAVSGTAILAKAGKQTDSVR